MKKIISFSLWGDNPVYTQGAIRNAELAKEIQVLQPDFTIDYAPDFRQAIADSWPNSIDDSAAQKDWSWKAQFDTKAMVKVMLENV